MKTSILNVRLKTSTKDALEYLCFKKDQPLSKVVREAINFYLKKEEDHGIEANRDEVVERDLLLLQSLEFTELIYWIMDKRRDPEMNEIYELYEQHMNLILELENNSFFDEEIMVEFKKIYRELEVCLTGNEDCDGYFKFSQDVNGFDYDKLNNVMHTLRYDKSNNRIIHIK